MQRRNPVLRAEGAGIELRDFIFERAISDQNCRDVVGRKSICMRGPRQDDGGTAILEHVAQPVGRIGKVQGQTGAACFQDGENGDNRFRAARQGDGDQGVRPNPATDQPARETVRTPVELAVGKRSAVADDGNLVGGRSGRRGDEIGQRFGSGRSLLDSPGVCLSLSGVAGQDERAHRGGRRRDLIDDEDDPREMLL